MKMMGGQSMKNTSGGGDVSLSPLPTNVDSHYAPPLSSYDVRVHEQTNRALDSLATRIDVGSRWSDEPMEPTDVLLQMNNDVVKIIVETKQDVWSNKEFFSLVDAYFDNIFRTLDFYAALENNLRRTRDSQFIIRLAIRRFESAENGGDDERHVKTFEELNFQEAGDPFSEEFVELCQSLELQHLSINKKLQVQKRKLEKKYSTIKRWKKVSGAIFVIASALVLIFSVVAAAMSAPPLVAAVAAALAAVSAVGKLCGMLWNLYLNSFEMEKQLVSSMRLHSFIILERFKNIRLLVHDLSIQLRLFLQNANLGIREQGGVMQNAVDEIKKNLQSFDETIEKLSAHAAKCSTDVTKARTVILQEIIRSS